MNAEVRQKGHVKFFNSQKGYGFILPNDQEEGEEVFVHHTAIHNDGGFKSLAEGEEVEYDLIKGPKGMQASNVTGPDGTSVQGDPRNQRYQRQSLEIDNNIMPINGGGYPVDSYSAPVVDPYSAPVVYPPMSMYPMYGGYMYPSYFVPNESMYTEQNKE
ncbi:unnamed protein product [Rhizopus stolonifer]